jgi:hypothetical protein
VVPPFMVDRQDRRPDSSTGRLSGGFGLGVRPDVLTGTLRFRILT